MNFVSLSLPMANTNSKRPQRCHFLFFFFSVLTSLQAHRCLWILFYVGLLLVEALKSFFAWQSHATIFCGRKGRMNLKTHQVHYLNQGLPDYLHLIWIFCSLKRRGQERLFLTAGLTVWDLGLFEFSRKSLKVLLNPVLGMLSLNLRVKARETYCAWKRLKLLSIWGRNRKNVHCNWLQLKGLFKAWMMMLLSVVVFVVVTRYNLDKAPLSDMSMVITLYTKPRPKSQLLANLARMVNMNSKIALNPWGTVNFWNIAMTMIWVAILHITMQILESMLFPV